MGTIIELSKKQPLFVHRLSIFLSFESLKNLGIPPEKKLLAGASYRTPYQKTDTTTQRYCTLSTYVTPKTISLQNQKTNTTPQPYCTLREHKYVKPKPISCQNQKLTQNHSWKKKASSPRAASVFAPPSITLSICKG